jgi:hypothetical protein
VAVPHGRCVSAAEGRRRERERERAGCLSGRVSRCWRSQAAKGTLFHLVVAGDWHSLCAGHSRRRRSSLGARGRASAAAPHGLDTHTARAPQGSRAQPPGAQALVAPSIAAAAHAARPQAAQPEACGGGERRERGSERGRGVAPVAASPRPSSEPAARPLPALCRCRWAPRTASPGHDAVGPQAWRRLAACHHGVEQTPSRGLRPARGLHGPQASQ